MASAQPAGQRIAGFWGGLLVLSAAPHNVNTLSTPRASA
jgi:hypothetical protein